MEIIPSFAFNCSSFQQALQMIEVIPGWENIENLNANLEGLQFVVGSGTVILWTIVNNLMNGVWE
ncbi:hypothetical protein MKX64_01735 [Paenibacillus sp. FSL M8-0334]|uniref:hypothetical protein n=1 Tax=Paenibacillus sp. FSL M8-0334 TaxID=2921623 RepID=UPI0030F66C4E